MPVFLLMELDLGSLKGITLSYYRTLCPATGHYSALQRNESSPSTRTQAQVPQPGKYHRTLIQPHPWEKTPQPRRRVTLRTFFFSCKSHYCFPLHISTFTLPFCGIVEFSFLFFLFKKCPLLKIFHLFCDFSDFTFDIFDSFSYSSLHIIVIPEYI